MFKIPRDVDKLQFLKDIFASNQYKLVDTYVIDDGKEHPFAIIVPTVWFVITLKANHLHKS